MEPIVFSYTISMANYRRMLYFNTFSLKCLQSLFVAVAWLGGFTALLLDLFGVVEPSQMMHLCFLIVSVAVPMIVVSLEIRVSKSKSAPILTQSRNVVFSDAGVRYAGGHKTATNLERWDEFLAVYETVSAFYLYKDVNNIVPVPKKGEPAEKLLTARACLKQNLGNRFRLRCK